MLTSRLYHRFSEPEVRRIAAELRVSQYWPLDRMRQYQFEKLKRLLEHAYQNVPYYRQMFRQCDATPDDVASFEDFARLPVLTKSVIREKLDELTAQNVPRERLVPNATGGSTGEPLCCYQDESYRLWAEAARIRAWYEMAGCRDGDRCAVLWGAVRDVRTDFSLTERLRDFCRDGEIKMNAFNLSDQRKLTFLRWCRLVRPKLLRGYVTAIKDFAAFLQERDLVFPRLSGIMLCAETVDEPSRTAIDQAFRTRSFNMYGGRELSLIAMECPARRGLHEVSENNYVEFEPAEIPGCPGAGHLIVTNLNNYGMPFIRYRLGDLGVPADGQPCDCGRGLPRIARIIGRTTEVFQFADGTKIAGELFIHLMKDFPLREYQFVQVSERQVVLRIHREDARDRELLGRLRSTYAPYLSEAVALDIEEVDRFERSATGKFRFVFRQESP